MDGNGEKARDVYPLFGRDIEPDRSRPGTYPSQEPDSSVPPAEPGRGRPGSQRGSSHRAEGRRDLNFSVSDRTPTSPQSSLSLSFYPTKGFVFHL